MTERGAAHGGVIALVAVLAAVGTIVALAQLPGPPVPFGCRPAWGDLPGMYRRGAIQVVVAATLVLALSRMHVHAIPALLVAVLVPGILVAGLATGYYAFDAGLRNELAGVPDCGGAWTVPFVHALVWSAPAWALVLDVVTTSALRRRRPRAWSSWWTAASVVVLGVAIAAHSAPMPS